MMVEQRIPNEYWQDKAIDKQLYYRPNSFKPYPEQLPSQTMGFLQNPFEGDKLKNWVMNPLTIGLLVIIAVSLAMKK